MRESRAVFPVRVMVGFFVVAAISATVACLVEPRCYSGADCTLPQQCLASGRCGFECSVDEECGAGYACQSNRCTPVAKPGLQCPAPMVPIADAFCIDPFEASRPDATADSAGAVDGPATSRQGVQPWLIASNLAAQEACQAAGKDLCTPEQWRRACQGGQGSTYSYGNDYRPEACNGIDTFGRSGFHLLPTGALPDCRNDSGVFDLNGNVWEHTRLGSDRTVRGGAFNCSDSRTYHRCDYIPGDWTPSALGFRCCKDAP